jgi:hypothetical protein
MVDRFGTELEFGDWVKFSVESLEDFDYAPIVTIDETNNAVYLKFTKYNFVFYEINSYEVALANKNDLLIYKLER